MRLEVSPKKRRQASRWHFRRAAFQEEYSLRFVDSLHRRRQFHFASINRRREMEAPSGPMLAGLGSFSAEQKWN